MRRRAKDGEICGDCPPIDLRGDPIVPRAARYTVPWREGRLAVCAGCYGEDHEDRAAAVLPGGDEEPTPEWVMALQAMEARR